MSNKTSKKFSDEQVSEIRALTLTDTLELLGLHVREDSTYEPTKNQNSKRLYVSMGGKVHELLVTGEKFFDMHTEKGGGGSIDLVMLLHKASFRQAMSMLIEQIERKKYAQPSNGFDDLFN